MYNTDDVLLSLIRVTLVSWQDIEYALENSSPSQQSGFETSIDKRSWDDIGGYGSLKTKLQRAVLLPISNPESYAKLGVPPPSGILLYGPSGKCIVSITWLLLLQTNTS